MSPGCSDEPSEQELASVVGVTEGNDGLLSAVVSARDGSFGFAALAEQDSKLHLGKSRYEGGHSTVGLSLGLIMACLLSHPVFDHVKTKDRADSCNYNKSNILGMWFIKNVAWASCKAPAFPS